MTQSMPTVSARDALSIAEKVARRPDEEAPDLPIPIKVGNEVQLLVMFLRTQGPPPIGYKPPKFAVTLRLDGKVLTSAATSAKDLGILAPDARQPGVGNDDHMPVEEFVSRRNKLYELSPKVWEAFAGGRSAKDGDVRPLLVEYWHLFNSITPQGIATFYVQASPAFFAWVRSAVEA